MKLKAVVDSLESVDESVRGLYAPGQDDLAKKFVLQVEASDGLQLAPVSKLQNALQSARSERDEALKLAKGLKDEEGNIIDIASLKRASEELEKLKKLGGKDEEKLKQLEDNLKLQYAEREKQLATKHSQEAKASEERLGHLRAQLHSALLVSEATKAITALGASPEVLLPHVERHVKAVEVEIDGKSQIRYDVIDPSTGQTRISTQPGSAENMTISELIGEFKKNKAFAGCFPADATGTGTNSRNGSGGNGTIVADGDPVERLKSFRRGA